MKKIYSLFILLTLIVTSATFTSCQMNTDDGTGFEITDNGGGNGNNQSGSETQNTPDPTYSFIPATEYTLVYEDGDTGKPYAGQKFKGSVLIAIAKELGLSTDSYTIDEANKKVTILTGKQLYNYLVKHSAEVAEKLTEIINGENNNGTGDNGGVAKAKHNIHLGSNSSRYNLLKNGYDNVNDVEEDSTVTLDIVKKADAVGYIVAKVSFTDNSTYEALNISAKVDYKKNQISFDMPGGDVSVSADIIDVVTDESNEWNFYVCMEAFEPITFIYAFKSEKEATESGYGGKCKCMKLPGYSYTNYWVYEATTVNDKSIVGGETYVEAAKCVVYYLSINNGLKDYLRVVKSSNYEALSYSKR